MRGRAQAGVIRALLPLLLLPLLGSVPAAAGTGSLPQLAGRTTISGTQSVNVLVRLTRPAVLRDPLFVDGAERDVLISSRARWAGFVLAQEGVNGPDRLVLLGGRTLGPKPVTYLYAVSGSTSEGSLPVGTYRLHLLTDGAPATVSLRFNGLTGSTSLTPRRASSVAFVYPTPDVDAEQARVTHAVGSGRRTRASTMLFSALQVDHAAHVEAVYTTCFYLERPTGPSPYLPGCPSPEERVIMPMNGPTGAADRVRHLVLASIVPLGDGEHASGASVISATPVDEVKYVQVWLRY